MSTYILDNRVGYVASYSTAIFLSSKQDELSRGCGITCPQFCFGKKQIWKIFSKEIKIFLKEIEIFSKEIKIFMKDSKAPAYDVLSFAFAKSKNDKSSWKKIFSKEIEIFLKEIEIFSKENLPERKFFSKENLFLGKLECVDFFDNQWPEVK